MTIDFLSVVLPLAARFELVEVEVGRVIVGVGPDEETLLEDEILLIAIGCVLKVLGSLDGCRTR